MNTVAAKLAIALVAVSLFAAMGGLLPLVMLVPGAVIERLYLWQPLTYAFTASDPLGVIFGAIILWQMGGAMESSWGAKRFLSFALGGTVLAGIITVLLALLIPSMRGFPYSGGYVMTSMLWIAYGLSIGRGQTGFWGMPVTGNVLALIGFGFIILSAAFGSVLGVVPPLIGALMAFAYTRGFSPRLLWLRFQSSRLQNQLKGRSKHLRVISKERNMPSDSDRYLH